MSIWVGTNTVAKDIPTVVKPVTAAKNAKESVHYL